MLIVRFLCKGEKGCVYCKVLMQGREGVCLLYGPNERSEGVCLLLDSYARERRGVFIVRSLCKRE